MVLLALMSDDIGLPPPWLRAVDDSEGVPSTSKGTQADSEANGSEVYDRRPKNYRHDPKKVMMKNVYAQLPDKTVINVSPTPGEGFYSGACIHP